MTPVREYDKEWTVPLCEHARQRNGYITQQGDIKRFLVQLEYELDDNWTEVVRFDHDSEGGEEMTHDVREEGLHMDVYRKGEKVDIEQVMGPISPETGFTAAEEHLEEHAEAYISRFEEWHQIDH